MITSPECHSKTDTVAIGTVNTTGSPAPGKANASMLLTDLFSFDKITIGELVLSVLKRQIGNKSTYVCP